MKKLNELTAGEIFQFVEKGLKFGICNLDGKFAYKTCNNKFFKYLGSSQYIEIKTYIELVGKFVEVDNTLFNCYINGRGENKKLYYENVTIVNN